MSLFASIGLIDSTTEETFESMMNFLNVTDSVRGRRDYRRKQAGGDGRAPSSWELERYLRECVGVPPQQARRGSRSKGGARRGAQPEHAPWRRAPIRQGHHGSAARGKEPHHAGEAGRPLRETRGELK